MFHTDSVPAPLGDAQSKPTRPVIWLIDDEPEIAAIARLLDAEGLDTCRCHFATALETLRARSARPSLIVMELIQSGIGGLVLCSKLRGLTDVPIVVYSRTCRSGDPAACQRLGATAFVHKAWPHAYLLQLIHRLSGSHPRTATEDDAKTLAVCVGALAIETTAPRAALNGMPVELTPTEHRLLLILAKAPGIPFTKRELARNLWGSAGAQKARSLSAHIHRMRRKLNLPSIPDAPQLKSSRGVGYVLSPASPRSPEPNELVQLPQAA